MKKIFFLFSAIYLSTYSYNLYAKDEVAHPNTSHSSAKDSHGHERHKGPVSAEAAYFGASPLCHSSFVF